MGWGAGTYLRKKKRTMKGLQTLEALDERVKELSCLYDISTIAAQNTSLPETMQAIANRVALAWHFAEKAVVRIVLLENSFLSGSLYPDFVSITEPVVSEGITGSIAVYYPADTCTIKDFLHEEKLLLHKVAEEIAAIAERYQRIENAALLKRTIEHSDRLSILGEITAGIAHELNTPLGNILGFSELIAEKTQSQQVRSDAQKITASAMYAREVVKKLMFFSCEMPQQTASIAINPLVDDAIKLLQPKLQSSGVTIHFVADKKNAFGRLDPIQITQVVFNLLLNAAHASASGSTVVVQISSDAKTIRIKISDKGHGIPEEIRPKIFEPFFSTKGVGQGSGLGLSVVHGIVKSHRGTIHVATETGIGTTFTITLPKHL